MKTSWNKEGRAEKIASKVLAVQEKGHMTLQQAQEIHGLLNFAAGQSEVAWFKIFSIVEKGENLPTHLEEWCKDVLSLLEESAQKNPSWTGHKGGFCFHGWIGKMTQLV